MRSGGERRSAVDTRAVARFQTHRRERLAHEFAEALADHARDVIRLAPRDGIGAALQHTRQACGEHDAGGEHVGAGSSQFPEVPPPVAASVRASLAAGMQRVFVLAALVLGGTATTTPNSWP